MLIHMTCPRTWQLLRVVAIGWDFSYIKRKLIISDYINAGKLLEDKLHCSCFGHAHLPNTKLNSQFSFIMLFGWIKHRKTRLEMCTLLSIVTFHRCLSCHITRHCCTNIIWGNCWITICSNNDLLLLLYNNDIVHAGCLPARRNARDSHGWACKVFFVHARTWRTPNSFTVKWKYILVIDKKKLVL